MSRTKEQLKKAKKLLSKPKGEWYSIDLSKTKHPEWMTRAFKNNRYVVMVADNTLMTDGSYATKIMVQRHDDSPIPNHWKELQSIKNELFGKEVTAIEYFPAESELADVSNIYWMFIIPNIIKPYSLGE